MIEVEWTQKGKHTQKERERERDGCRWWWNDRMFGSFRGEKKSSKEQSFIMRHGINKRERSTENVFNEGEWACVCGMNEFLGQRCLCTK